VISWRPPSWLQQLATENDFAVDYITNTDPINDAFLAKYRLFIQLNYPPYRWTPVAKKAFQRYITRGTGGWIGFHHAMLLGDFDGYKMWPWWSHFMGDIRYTSYIAQFATATVKVDDPGHPVTKGLPSSFTVQQEEWYTWSRSNRNKVHVLASVDESTYSPKSMITMGDHPVVWTNEHVKAGTFTSSWAITRTCLRTRTLRSSSGTPSSGVRASEKAFSSRWSLCSECCFRMRRRGARRPALRPKVLFLFLNVENDHVLFALDALRFFAELAQKDNFTLEATTNWEDLNDVKT
jgi:hypothetical protein